MRRDVERASTNGMNENFRIKKDIFFCLAKIFVWQTQSSLLLGSREQLKWQTRLITRQVKKASQSNIKSSRTASGDNEYPQPTKGVGNGNKRPTLKRYRKSAFLQSPGI